MAYVAPWWSHWGVDHSLRRWVHRPQTLLGPHVADGMTVLDVGCGMGVFSLPMARMVGPEGRVIALDIEQRALDILIERAARAGLSGRIVARRCSPGDLGLAEFEGQAAFALAFWMVHEAPDLPAFLAQVRACLGPGGRFLVAEPIFHVGRAAFIREVAAAESAGFAARRRPHVLFSRAVLLEAV